METYSVTNERVTRGLLFPTEKRIVVNPLRSCQINLHKCEDIAQPFYLDCTERKTEERRKELPDDPYKNKKCPYCSSIWTQWKFEEKNKIWIRRHPDCGQQISGYIVHKCGVSIRKYVSSKRTPMVSMVHSFPEDQKLLLVLWRIDFCSGLNNGDIVDPIWSEHVIIEDQNYVNLFVSIERNGKLYAEQLVGGNKKQKLLLNYNYKEGSLIVEKGGISLFEEKLYKVEELTS